MPVASFSLPELIDASRSHSPGGRVVLDRFDAALRDPGAFRLSDLPISEALVEQMHDATCEFFELPMDVKAGYRFIDDQYVGWCGGEFLSQYGSADHKEMYHVGPRVAPTLVAHAKDGSVPLIDEGTTIRALATCGLWPAAPRGFIAVWHEYYGAMQGVAASLGAVLASLLGIERDEWFDTMQGNWADLAANYYPPIVDSGAAGQPVYNAAHSDLTVFTILHQDQSRAGGLSVQAIDGSWDDVEPVPGTYVVNVGELLTYLSAGRWRAAPHQVTVSLDTAPSTSPRISVPFFYRPSDKRIVTSFVDPNAAPIAVGDWVLERKRASRAVPR
ncbi:MAG: flavanone 3-dioxygenase [Acidimicrobiaceae bacterium]|nr:flavanone 3-dioxygenase [Acidimicrobiaceae bacterium]